MAGSLISSGGLDLAYLAELVQCPALFAQWEPDFWVDPHIAGQMLATHLNPDIEAASRSPQVIDRTVAWIAEQTRLPAGGAILDLGCGPGLYAIRWMQKGFKVTGVDQSGKSIAYAQQADPVSTYLCQNYLTLDFAAAFDVVVLIFGDFCVLPDAERDRLLQIVHRALKPGGYFVFDVSTWRQCENKPKEKSWSLHPDGGFWKPTAHLELSEVFVYPEQHTWVDQYTIIEADGSVSVYRTWLQSYSPERIQEVLGAQGFALEHVYSDLAGTPWHPDSEWLGLVARRENPV